MFSRERRRAFCRSSASLQTRSPALAAKHMTLIAEASSGTRGYGGTACDLLTVFLLQLLVDGDGGLSAFGGGDDDELDVAVGVAGQEEIADAGAPDAVGFDVVVAVDTAAEFLGQGRALELAGVEEECSACV